MRRKKAEKLAAIATPKASPAPTIMQGGPNVEELQGELEKQKALIERLQEQLKLTEASTQPEQQPGWQWYWPLRACDGRWRQRGSKRQHQQARRRRRRRSCRRAYFVPRRQPCF